MSPALMLLSVALAPLDSVRDSGIELLAWVVVERASIRHEPRIGAPVVGLVERGDRLAVATCVPACDDADGWATLSPFGALPLATLSFKPPEVERPPDAPFIYAKVSGVSARVHSLPDESSTVIATHPKGHVLAFWPEPQPEWLSLVHGGSVARSEVVVLTASAFHGQAKPAPLFAFTRRATESKSALTGVLTPVERHAYVAVTDASGEMTQWVEGVISRSALHVGGKRPRPSSISPDAKWIHIDLDQQVLTAYEGDSLVYATLVSTGKSGWSTPTGTFRVWLKVRHGTMEGHRQPYHVEEVPHSMFFNRSVALHGTAWHDSFGTAVSHGCVNLAPQDAAWLFTWSTPVLPEGWHTLLPQAAGLESVWVVIENAARLSMNSERLTDRLSNDQHGAGRRTNDALGHAADQCAAKAATTVCAHDDQISLQLRGL